MKRLFVLFLGCWLAGVLAEFQIDNRARFDHYRLYRFQLATGQHVKLFQDLEERSDSYMFSGHARQIGQRLNVLVAAHKIAEITEIVKRFKVEYEIMVRGLELL